MERWKATTEQYVSFQGLSRFVSSDVGARNEKQALTFECRP